jgi:hypothetical protein
MRRAALALLALLAFERASAQDTVPLRPIFVNDEWERYARVLQATGDVPLHPWSVRSFGPSSMRRVAALGVHPWDDVPLQTRRSWRRLTLTSIPATAGFAFNSAYPFGYNDGAVWAGRGVTAFASGGIVAEAGPLSIVFAPTLFRAQNDSFLLRDNGQSGIYLYGAPYSAHEIDHPQRFGDGAYGRMDLGNSSAQLEGAVMALGISNAPMHWGPARDHPMLFGNNAGGFTHVFAGTSTPLDLRFLRVHGRILWGKLYGTPYARVHETAPARFATGLVGVITPRGAPGLEIGGGRFFHLQWDSGVLNATNLLLTLSELPLPNTTERTGYPDNQIASVFARWVFPEAGFEIYGEYGREDHSADTRDFELQPDHNAGYLVGVQRVIRAGDRQRRVLRAEVLNTRVAGLVLVREQTMWYTHLPVAQGHTNRGQVLGSAGAFGGGAATIAYDSYSPAGRWTVGWTRLMRGEDEAFPSGETTAMRADVQHALGASGVHRVGRSRRLGVSWEATWVRGLNRDMRGDAANLRIGSGIEYVW